MLRYREELIKYIRFWHKNQELNGNIYDVDRLVSELSVSNAQKIIQATSDRTAGEILGNLAYQYNLTFVTEGGGGAMGGDQIAASREAERTRGQRLRSVKSYLGRINSPKIEVIQEDISVSEFARRVDSLISKEIRR